MTKTVNRFFHTSNSDSFIHQSETGKQVAEEPTKNARGKKIDIF